MTTNNAAPDSRAISGSLARELLRDRDINCPRCDYPLRDATTNTCPECGCQLTVTVCDASNPEPSKRLIKAGALLLFLFSVASVIGNIASLITDLIIDNGPVTLVHGIFYFGAQVFWMCMLFWTARLWSRTRKNRPTPPRAVLKPAIVCVVMAFLGAGLITYSAFLVAWTFL